MIQRVKPQAESLLGEVGIAETDPALLEEMVALVMAQGLDVVSLDEAKRRLAAFEARKRFVTFTFDGAFRSTLEAAATTFKDRGLPFTLFVGTDYVDTGQLPWWIALEALILSRKRLSVKFEGKPQDLVCGTMDEKRACYSRLYHASAKLEAKQRADHVEALCRSQSFAIGTAAYREMLSGVKLKALAGEPLVEIGSLAGGGRQLSELSYDDAKEELTQSLAKLEALLGNRPRHIAYPGTEIGSSGAREFKLASSLGVETAVTAVEGALWPEHAADPFALPRIALDNDPATLVRALMLSGGTPFASDTAAIA